MVTVEVDTKAITHNVRTLVTAAHGAQVLAVVKADAYGHGLHPVAAAARAGGATWLGVAQPDEALQLRDGGDRGRVLTWLVDAHTDISALVERDIDVSVNSTAVLNRVRDAARASGLTARIHVAIDTGLGREGAPRGQWVPLAAASASATASGLVSVVGVWSHLAWADAPGHPTVDAQEVAFREALAVFADAGIVPEHRHLANSAATLTRPDLHHTLVRPGIAVYGLPPVDDPSGENFGLRPAMRVTSHLTLVKRLPAGHGVSYGHEFVTDRDTTVGLVPVGYADGMFRSVGGAVSVSVAGALYPLVGRVCMDQVVIDLGPDSTAGEGDEVVLMGVPGLGAREWAQAASTIDYEVVCRWGIGRDKVYV